MLTLQHFSQNLVLLVIASTLFWLPVCELHAAEPEPSAELHVLYDGVVHETDVPQKEHFLVTYTKGPINKEVTDFDIDPLTPITENTDITVSTDYGDSNYTITPIPVEKVSIESDHSYIAGEIPEFTQLRFLYLDGYEKCISVEDVTWNKPPDQPLSLGNNIYHFIYCDKEYALNIRAEEGTNVEQALMHCQDELTDADYSYTSDTIFVTVKRITYESGADFYLSHIVINSPSQMHSGLSYDDYGGERETPLDASKRLNWVIGTNGSNFNYGTGAPEYAGVCIKNGEVMDGTQTNGMEICLMSNGILYSPEEGVHPLNLIDSGVTDSWSCGDTLLIQDGLALNVGIQSNQYRYPRTAIGMVQPCEYYLITAGSGNYEGGMTYDEVRDTLMNHGCVFGKCMDGGGSSALILQNNLINTPATGDIRAVADFMYWTE